MTVEIGQAAPPFQLRNVDGEYVGIDDLKGHKSLVVFIPFPFTGTCEGELCAIRDRLAELNDLDANVVAITTAAVPTNRAWSEQNSFGFPVLSDFWPHGEVTAAYGTFDDAVGAANRTSFILDADGTVQAVVAVPSRSEAREFDLYVEALNAV